MLKAAMERAGTTEPQQVVEALETLGTYRGVTGTLEFSPDVENREWVLPGH